MIAIGGTRTAFILENNRYEKKKKKITSFTKYAEQSFEGYFSFIRMFLEFGGQNLVMPILAYQRFYEKGQEYAGLMAQLCLWLTRGKAVEFYQQNQIDPYFAGIDILLHLPEDHVGHQLAKQLTEFQQNWRAEAVGRLSVPLTARGSARPALPLRAGTTGGRRAAQFWVMGRRRRRRRHHARCG